MNDETPRSEYTPEQLAWIYAEAKKNFKVEDLIREMEADLPTIPAEDVLAELERDIVIWKSQKRGAA